VKDPDVKDAVRTTHAHALSLGVFGVPTSWSATSCSAAMTG